MKDQSNGNRGAIGDLKGLTRSEARFQQSVDLSPEVVLSLDERGIILFWNQCCERISGCSAEETLGVDFASRFVEPSQNDLIVEIVSRVFRGESISGLELDFVAHNGIKRNMIFRAHPINDGSGKVIECLLVGGDVNELIQAEEALQASERRYRHLTENSLTGIYIHQDGVFTYVNDRLATMMGYSTEEVIGKEFWSFVHPEDRQVIRDRGLM
jgi:PAS domain S-box-containing protein